MKPADFIRTETHDPELVERAWPGVSARAVSRRRRRRVMRAGGVLAGSATLVAAILLVGGRFTAQTDTASARRHELRLRDGTLVVTAGGAQVAVIADTELEQRVRLAHGTAHFDVPARPARTFSVEVRDVEFRVLGTRFTIVADSGTATVGLEVERGTVEVRRPGIATIRVQANQGWKGPLSLPPAPAPTPLVPPPGAPEETPAAPAPAPTPAASAATDLNRLFEKATRARAASDWDAARVAFRSVMTRDPRGRLGALAALELGRLEMGRGGDMRAAAAAFESALRADPSSPLREDAMARLIQAYDRAGDTGRCHEAKARYMREFPAGLHAQSLGPLCTSGGGH